MGGFRGSSRVWVGGGASWVLLLIVEADQEAKKGLDSETKLNTELGKKEIYSIIKRHKMEESVMRALERIFVQISPNIDIIRLSQVGWYVGGLLSVQTWSRRSY